VGADHSTASLTPAFTALADLASARVGGRALAANDEVDIVVVQSDAGIQRRKIPAPNDRQVAPKVAHSTRDLDRGRDLRPTHHRNAHGIEVLCARGPDRGLNRAWIHVAVDQRRVVAPFDRAGHRHDRQRKARVPPRCDPRIDQQYASHGAYESF